MIDFQNANEIFDVYGIYPRENKVEQMMIGRFLVQDGKLRILEDHNGMLGHMLINGPVGHNAAGLESLTRSQYTKVVSESEVAEGHHINLVPKGTEPNVLGPRGKDPHQAIEQPDATEAPQSYHVENEPEGFSLTTPPAVFDYIRAGMREPQILEVRGEDVYMNGQKLSRNAVNYILTTIHNGIGKLKYRKAV